MLTFHGIQPMKNAYLKPMKTEPMKLPCHKKGMKMSWFVERKTQNLHCNRRLTSATHEKGNSSGTTSFFTHEKAMKSMCISDIFHCSHAMKRNTSWVSGGRGGFNSLPNSLRKQKTLYKVITPGIKYLYADDHYSTWSFTKDTLKELQNLTLVHSNVPHWIHLFLVLETIWCFFSHV